MTKIFLILGLLLFGQLGDRYPTDESDAALPLESSAEANSTSADQLPQDTTPTESTTAQTELFEDSPSDSVEQTKEADSTVADESPAIDPLGGSNASAPPATNVPQASAENDPETVLKSFSEPVTGSQLAGTPVALAEVIASSTTRREQTQRVEIYWDLSQAVLDYNLALKEKIELAALHRGITQSGPQWEKSLNQAESCEQLALERAKLAQQRVAEILNLASEDHAPIPSDLPYVGTYNTRFTELFPQQGGIFQGQTPRIAKEYDEYLTSAGKFIEGEVHEIADAKEWMFAVSEQRSPDTDGRELLAAYELFAANRRLFVQTICDYNRQIVHYTELATPGTVEPQRLVAMLIRVEGAPASTVDSEVRRASAEETAPQQRSTPENSWHALPNNSERSILVPRQ